MAQNLTSKTLSGLSWTTAASVVQFGAQIAYTPIMARFLDPIEFGLVALAGVVLRFATILSGMGIDQAVIQKEELTKENIRAAFTLMFGLSVFFYVLIWVAAPWSTYLVESDDKRLIPVIRVMAISFLITGMFSLSNGLLRRDLKFKITAPIQVFATLVGFFAVGVVLAYNGFGVWSLVFATLTQFALLGILNYSVVRHDLRPIFGWKYYKPLFSFGSQNTLVTFLEFTGANMVTLLTSKLFGLRDLGFYNQANRLVRLPVFYLNRSVSSVLFPAFSRVQADKKKLRGAYLSAVTLSGFIFIPTFWGLSMMAEPVVLIMLGEKWKDSIPLLQLIALAPPITFISHYAGVMLMALAKLKLKMYIQILFLIVIGTCMYFLYPLGVTGLIASFLIAKSVHHICNFIAIRNILEFKTKKMLMAYTPGLIAGFITVGAMYLVNVISDQLELHFVITFVMGIAAGATSLVLALFVDPNGIVRLEIVDKIEKIAGKKRGGVMAMIYRFSQVLKY